MRKAVWLGVGAMVAILAAEVTAQQTVPAKPAARRDGCGVLVNGGKACA
jgi:hypothetical protein